MEAFLAASPWAGGNKASVTSGVRSSGVDHSGRFQLRSGAVRQETVASGASAKGADSSTKPELGPLREFE